MAPTIVLTVALMIVPTIALMIPLHDPFAVFDFFTFFHCLYPSHLTDSLYILLYLSLYTYPFILHMSDHTIL
ncbi:hypothetical protein GGU11DRAFT_803493, partial [Lentinula aff. detonsa]